MIIQIAIIEEPENTPNVRKTITLKLNH